MKETILRIRWILGLYNKDSYMRPATYEAFKLIDGLKEYEQAREEINKEQTSSGE